MSATQVSFIDKFVVPEKGVTEFLDRVTVNRKFIKNLQGFIRDNAYERTDENRNLVFITIAIWESEQSVKNAKEAVQAEYRRQGFNPEEMFQRLGITMDRGIYNESVTGFRKEAS